MYPKNADKIMIDYPKESIDIPVFNSTLIDITNSKRTRIFTIICQIILFFYYDISHNIYLYLLKYN